MSRACRTLLPAAILAVRLSLAQNVVKPPAPLPDEAQLPPDEDAALTAPKQYGFNPVQSRRELEAGMVYMKKGNFKAAAGRFHEATRWNETNAEAWLLLGEAEEKRGNSQEARRAFQHYLEVAPDGKGAVGVKRRLERLK